MSLDFQTITGVWRNVPGLSDLVFSGIFSGGRKSSKSPQSLGTRFGIAEAVVLALVRRVSR
jgi:hypothetical protein